MNLEEARHVATWVSPMPATAHEAMKVLVEHLDPLLLFVGVVFDQWPESLGMDGFELEAVALNAGLLVRESVHAPCSDLCQCAQLVGEEGWPVYCNRSTPLLKAALEAWSRHANQRKAEPNG